MRGTFDATSTDPRLFVAVPLPPPAAARVAALVGEVQADVEAAAGPRRSPVRWVRLDGLHLTLRFLGPTDTERVAAVRASVDRAAATSEPFGVTLAGAGAFPSAHRPRTLWLGVADGERPMAALTRALDGELQVAGWPAEERPFRPHLTLARADGRREGPLAAERLAVRAAGVEIPFVADRVVLFESVTGGGPARYVPVHEAPLGP